jgi:hypothetical protein
MPLEREILPSRQRLNVSVTYTVAIHFKLEPNNNVRLHTIKVFRKLTKTSPPDPADREVAPACSTSYDDKVRRSAITAHFAEFPGY